MHLRAVQRVHIARLVRGLDLAPELGVLLVELHASDAWSDQHQLGDSLRVFEREIDGEPSADRAADHVSGFEVQLLHEGRDVRDRRPSSRRQLGLAEAAHIGRDDVELLRERLDLRLPHARIGDSRVKKDDRHAIAGAFVVDPRAMDRCLHQTSAVSSALNLSSVSSSSRAGSESGMTPTPA